MKKKLSYNELDVKGTGDRYFGMLVQMPIEIAAFGLTADEYNNDPNYEGYEASMFGGEKNNRTM